MQPGGVIQPDNQCPGFFGVPRPVTAPRVGRPHRAKNGSNGEDDGFGDDEGFGDNDAFADLLDEYDEMVEEKRDIARCICDEIWDNPAKYLKSK